MLERPTLNTSGRRLNAIQEAWAIERLRDWLKALAYPAGPMNVPVFNGAQTYRMTKGGWPVIGSRTMRGPQKAEALTYYGGALTVAGELDIQIPQVGAVGGGLGGDPRLRALQYMPGEDEPLLTLGERQSGIRADWNALIMSALERRARTTGGAATPDDEEMATRESGLDVEPVAMDTGAFSALRKTIMKPFKSPTIQRPDPSIIEKVARAGRGTLVDMSVMPKLDPNFNRDVKMAVPLSRHITKVGAAMLRDLELYTPAGEDAGGISDNETDTNTNTSGGGAPAGVPFALPSHTHEDQTTMQDKTPGIDQITGLFGAFNSQQLIAKGLRCDASHHKLEHRRDVQTENRADLITIGAGGDLIALLAAGLFGSATAPTLELFDANSNATNKNRYRGMFAHGLAIMGEWAFIPDAPTTADEFAQAKALVDAGMHHILSAYAVKALRTSGSADYASSPVPLLNFFVQGADISRRQFRSIGDFVWEDDSSIQVVAPYDTETNWSLTAAGASRASGAAPTLPVPVVAGKVFVSLAFFVEFIGSLEQSKKK